MRNMGYQIRSFMWEKLSLGGSELLVYAVIYSFSQGEEGRFFGSQSFLSDVTGLSVSTVKRALHSLLDSGLIERLTPGGRVMYRSVILEEGDIIDTPCECENGTPIKEDNIINKPTAENQVKRVAPPKHKFLSLGKDGIIQMTNAQYKKLLALVSEEQLSAYIRKMELLIMTQKFRIHNPYKTLIKWINKDTRV